MRLLVAMVHPHELPGERELRVLRVTGKQLSDARERHARHRNEILLDQLVRHRHGLAEHGIRIVGDVDGVPPT